MVVPSPLSFSRIHFSIVLTDSARFFADGGRESRDVLLLELQLGPVDFERGAGTDRFILLF